MLLQQKEANRYTKGECKLAEKEANRLLGLRRTMKQMSMIVGDSSYAEITSALWKGLKRSDINIRWNQRSKESSSIIKPFVKRGKQSSMTAKDDEAITKHADW